MFKDTLSQRWSLFAGFSGDRSNTYLDGRALPDLVPESVRSPSNGYLRVGGQVAFKPLTNSMQFTVGSDAGIRGLPGQFLSGDNGWLCTAEVAWTFWQKNNQSLQLVPFIGMGGVTTTLAGVTFSDTVGSSGILARWLAGNTWLVELGWVEQFETNGNLGEWSDWALGKGLYAQVKYRF